MTDSCRRENPPRAPTTYSGFYACADLLRHCCPRRCADAAAGFRQRVAWLYYINITIITTCHGTVMLPACGYVARCRRTTVQCSDCTTFHFLWCLRIASFGAVIQLFFFSFSNSLNSGYHSDYHNPFYFLFFFKKYFLFSLPSNNNHSVYYSVYYNLFPFLFFFLYFAITHGYPLPMGKPVGTRAWHGSPMGTHFVWVPKTHGYPWVISTPRLGT